MPLFTVPKDDLAPTYQPLPTGHYQGDVIGLELTPEGTSAKDANWRALRGSLANITTPEGAGFVQNGAAQIALAGKTRRFQITVGSSSPKALEIGSQQVVRLGLALGISQEDDDGNLFVPGEDIESVVTALRFGEGRRVNFSLKTGARMRGGVVQFKTGTEIPIIDEEVRTFWVVANDD